MNSMPLMMFSSNTVYPFFKKCILTQNISAYLLIELKIYDYKTHVLISSFWTCVCEPFVHDMSWAQMEEHCRIVCRFFNWKEVIMLERPR